MAIVETKSNITIAGGAAADYAARLQRRHGSLVAANATLLQRSGDDEPEEDKAGKENDGPGALTSPLLRSLEANRFGGLPNAQDSNVAEPETVANNLLFPAQEPSRPTLVFAMPLAQTNAEIGPTTSQTFSGAIGSSSVSLGQPQRPARRADTRAVSDRVYDLMKQEAAVVRQRGGAPWRGSRRG